ncbi:hypothetical protein Xcel_2695 [Xylanimonas cellulosilytica DSM 15894]|uniref:Lipopolysaccharide biosynthesis protein n=1 Tax=Xylanimonas cellulosilytica (strain DSM 15894 / JCM 12276 / CECT 5975 / KCTC 9989 / LMG 20990 / NBRC 107835 / XIL07) TaxID=446471 RepID=D1BXR8_XYLCX|nr:hypothetical protein [Xylanimonas cellulosilytica]ACZ31709.1 hypothetical protein Xcel_2695 [Xylanimonas cellulosilytica DSM 15894]
MTIESMLRAFRTYWYVVLAGALLTLAAGALAARPVPLYWTQADVLVLAPGMGPQDMPSDLSLDGMLAFAGMLEREANGRPVSSLESGAPPLFSAGVRDGYSVAVPNQGNQWTNVFLRPVLSVEVVGSDAETVAQRYDQIVAQLEASSQTLQNAVAPERRMTLHPVTDDPTVSYVGSTNSQKIRALGAIAVIGVFVSASAAVLLDQRARRRRAAGEGLQAVGTGQPDEAQQQGAQPEGTPPALQQVR